MTLPDAESSGAEPPAASANAVGQADAPGAALPRGCPFLEAAGGGWRLDLPSRDHRCGAVVPAAPLSPEKQTRLCLTPAHAGCATFLASIGAREARLGAVPLDRATRWGLARTTSVIEDPGGLRSWVVGQLLDRRRWPAVPAVLLVTTLFTLAISGFRASIPAVPVATSSPGPAHTPRITPRPTPPSSAATTPERTPAPSHAPTTPPPSTRPTASAPPTPTSSLPSATFRSYTVKSGDALSSIAAKFHTTARAIADLNHITIASRLHIGQVLLIP